METVLALTMRTAAHVSTQSFYGEGSSFKILTSTYFCLLRFHDPKLGTFDSSDKTSQFLLMFLGNLSFLNWRQVDSPVP